MIHIPTSFLKNSYFLNLCGWQSLIYYMLGIFDILLFMSHHANCHYKAFVKH